MRSRLQYILLKKIEMTVCTKVLKNFKIEKYPRTEIVYNKCDSFFANYQEVYLRFVKR